MMNPEDALAEAEKVLKVMNPEEALKDMQGYNKAQAYHDARIGEETRAALYALGRVEDAFYCLHRLHELINGNDNGAYEGYSGKLYQETLDAYGKLREKAFTYLGDSINEALGVEVKPGVTVEIRTNKANRDMETNIRKEGYNFSHLQDFMKMIPPKELADSLADIAMNYVTSLEDGEVSDISKIKSDVSTLQALVEQFRKIGDNVLVGTIEVDGIKLGRSMLADAVWQGCKHMKQERDTHPDRRAFLDERIRKSAFYHYVLLGCSGDEAVKLADEFLQDGT